jgi:hypothetical protein
MYKLYSIWSVQAAENNSLVASIDYDKLAAKKRWQVKFLTSCCWIDKSS